MHRTGRCRAAAPLVLAAGPTPARLVAPRRPCDGFAICHAMGHICAPSLLGILIVLGTPGHVVLDDDRRDGADRNALTSHPLDVAVEARAVVAMRRNFRGERVPSGRQPPRLCDSGPVVNDVEVDVRETTPEELVARATGPARWRLDTAGNGGVPVTQTNPLARAAVLREAPRTGPCPSPDAAARTARRSTNPATVRLLPSRESRLGTACRLVGALVPFPAGGHQGAGDSRGYARLAVSIRIGCWRWTLVLLDRGGTHSCWGGLVSAPSWMG